MASGTLTIREHNFVWGERTYLMGVLNVTPDSFSDGGEFNNPDSALAQAKWLVESGADLIDVGGQSTRPGAVQISLEEELQRVLPVIRAIRSEMSIPVSVDTTRSAVAAAAIEAGADMVNDISGGTFDEQMLSRVAQLGIPIILMHIKGTPETMQQLTQYQDLIREIYQFLARRMAAAEEAGIKRSQIILDPGIGFAKTYEQSLELLRGLEKFHSLDAPILVGPSRKSFLGHTLEQKKPKQRLWGTAAACCAAIAGGADLLRVHDVAQMYDVCRIADAIWRN